LAPTTPAVVQCDQYAYYNKRIVGSTYTITSLDSPCKKCKPNEAEGDSTAALRVCRYAAQSLFTQYNIGIIQQILLVYQTKLFGACTLRSKEYSQQVDNIHLTGALFHLVPEFCHGIGFTQSGSSRTVSCPHVSTLIAPPRTGEHEHPRIEVEVRREKKGRTDLVGVLPRHLPPHLTHAGVNLHEATRSIWMSRMPRKTLGTPMISVTWTTMPSSNFWSWLVNKLDAEKGRHHPPGFRGHGDSQTVGFFPPKTPPHHFQVVH
jgi:hypothetical protein